jgi:hypothetical protein
MAKPTDKITATMTRSEWNKFMAKLTSHDIETRHSAAIELERKIGLQ